MRGMFDGYTMRLEPSILFVMVMVCIVEIYNIKRVTYVYKTD